MSTRTRALLAVVAVVVTAAVVAGLLLLLRSPAPVDDEEPGGYRSRALGTLETHSIAVVRGPLCEGVPEEAVHEALGRQPVRLRAYGNGDITKLTPEVRDIAHEFGCAWRTPKVTAHTWVYAPPVPRQRARQLAAAAAGRTGCRRIDDAPAFGRPSSGLICRAKGELRASYQGLFGDAWLSCEISSRGKLDREQLVRRTGRWCAAVLSQF